jgi:hypothetical protein
MSAIRLAVTAVTVAVAVARHPLVRAGVRAVVDNPRLNAAAIEATKVAAYNAGRVARRIVPRSLIQ